MTTVLIVLLGVAGLVALVVVVGWILSKFVVGTNAARAAHALGPPEPDDHDESAALLAPEHLKGFGTMRLTDSELLFARGSTRDIIRVARADIESVQPTEEASGRRIKRPALAVVRRSDPRIPLIFAVGDAEAWSRRLG